MALQILYDARFDGAQLEALKDGALFTTSVTDHGEEYGASEWVVVTTTGYYYKGEGSIVFLQTTEGYYLIVDLNNPSWGATAGNPVKQYSVSAAQKLVDTIINNNKTIIACNLFCARFADKLTQTQKAQLYGLQERLEERNERLREDGLVDSIEENYPTGYVFLNSYLKQFMGNKQNSVGSVTITIIVAAVVIASLSTAAYYAYRYYAKQSEDDVRFSKELTETLMSKLTPEEYEELKKETAGIVTKARIKQTLSTVGAEIKIIGAIAAVLGGYILYKQWQSNRN